MNYEELLAAKNNGKLNHAQWPIGEYYRSKVDGKYRGIVDIRPELHQNIVFTKALQEASEANKRLANNHLLHYELVSEGSEINQLIVETGTYISFENLLADTPAVVAENNFIFNTLKDLVEIATFLHEKDIRQICFSPRTVMARKGDNAVMLLFHGSFFNDITDLQSFYGQDASFVAPEVLNHGTIDDRCDVYSIGKFLETLFEKAELPLEYKQVIKKATSESPEDRYNSPADMLKAVENRHKQFRSVLTFVGALAISLICIGIYFEMFPESTPVEFVKPAPRQATDDLIDDGFSPEELGVVSADSITVPDSIAANGSTPDYQAKAEQIFRKKYEKEADRILSEIYSKDYMGATAKEFMAKNQETLKELMETQQKMGEDASLTPERSQLIASQIIERITNEKKQQLGKTNRQGIQKSDNKE